MLSAARRTGSGRPLPAREPKPKEGQQSRGGHGGGVARRKGGWCGLIALTQDRRMGDGARRDVVSGLLRQPGGFEGLLPTQIVRCLRKAARGPDTKILGTCGDAAGNDGHLRTPCQADDGCPHLGLGRLAGPGRLHPVVADALSVGRALLAGLLLAGKSGGLRISISSSHRDSGGMPSSLNPSHQRRTTSDVLFRHRPPSISLPSGSVATQRSAPLSDPPAQVPRHAR
jgi:hypothetical protein